MVSLWRCGSFEAPNRRAGITGGTELAARHKPMKPRTVGPRLARIGVSIRSIRIDQNDGAVGNCCLVPRDAGHVLQEFVEPARQARMMTNDDSRVGTHGS
jgi:hypothetical protein